MGESFGFWATDIYISCVLGGLCANPLFPFAGLLKKDASLRSSPFGALPLLVTRKRMYSPLRGWMAQLTLLLFGALPFLVTKMQDISQIIPRPFPDHSRSFSDHSRSFPDHSPIVPRSFSDLSPIVPRSFPDHSRSFLDHF